MARKKQNSKIVMEQKRRRRQLLTFWRIIKYGANSFIRNAWLSVAATAVMTVTLVIILGSFLARTVLNDTVNEIKDKVEISVYLQKELKEDEVNDIKNQILNLESVIDVRSTSPEDAKNNFSSQNANDADIRTALIEASNEFFWILNIKLVDLGDTTELENLVEDTDFIKKSLHPDHPPTYESNRKQIIDNISNTIRFAEKVGVLAAVIFVIIASLIIFNTIRMAIFNRREEIYMMKLIGANKTFISGPFLVESMICGTLAAVLASIIGFGVVNTATPTLQRYGIVVSEFLSDGTNYAVFIMPVLIIVGSTIGILSSLTATRKYLKI